MKLHCKYCSDDKGVDLQSDGKPMPNKENVGHLINQAIIWIAIIFLAVVAVKRLF